MVGEARIKHGRKAETSFCIVDAQSVKNTDTAEEKGYDAGKKVSGIKRHVAVDTQGLPHAIAVTTANVTDREGALIALRMEKENLTNVIFIDAITKTEMPSVLKSVNAVIVPLRKLDLFKGAIPSKLFESLAMQLPVLLGVDGEARELFIEHGKCGLYFEPENVEDLTKQVLQISSDSNLAKQLGENGRKYVNNNFNRDNIANKFLEQLNKL